MVFIPALLAITTHLSCGTGMTSFMTRLQTYWSIRSHVSWPEASTSHLSTLALTIRPLSSQKATTLWTRALKTDLVRPFERLVLDSMTVDDAAERIGRSKVANEYSPLGFLASMLIRERIRDHASSLFVRTVLPDLVSEDGTPVHDADGNKTEENERRRTFEAAKSLGGRPGELAELLENVWKTGYCDVDEVLPNETDDNADSVDAEIQSLITALILYRQIFPSSIFSGGSVLSPPPSPSRHNTALHLSLKRALASSAFDFKGHDQTDTALEDARDHVVDTLFDLERTL
jgi:hypothetical protein